MADWHEFIGKHRRTARQHGTAPALRNASLEATVWGISRVRERIGHRGRRIWDDDWDICLVADACRLDLFEEVTPEYDWLPSEAESAWSVGSASPDWYGTTFDPENIPDGERIGVITANPFAGKTPRKLPHLLGAATPIDKHGLAHVDYAFEESWGCEVDGEYLDVTHPAELTNRAYDAWTNLDLDRLVVHYMQPHIPFRSRPEWFGTRENLQHFGERLKDGERPYQDDSKEVWRQVRDGELDPDEVWTAYRDNLRWVLDDINRLRRGVSSDVDILLTSDHGNAMGEWGLWSHPPSVHTSELREVPWVHVLGASSGWERREVAPAGDTEDISQIEQLRALGYHE